MKWFYKKKGFTLLELMIVIVIVGILASIAIPRYFDAIESARGAEAKGTLGEIYKIEQAYYSVHSAYMPTTNVGNGLTVGVDLDGIAGDEISMVIPNSSNFTYSKTAVAGNIRATATAGTTNWQMNLGTGQISTF